MSAAPPPRSTKLKFKGEKTKKRKRHAAEDRGKRRETETDPQAWILPETPNEVLGPTFIVHPSSPPSCISYEATRARVTLQPVATADDGTSVLALTPTEVAHVWVATRVAGALTINLRTPDGKFLSCDAHGIITADREARGPQEEFTPVVLDDGMVAFQNVYEKFVAVDEVAGGTMQLRGDSERVGFGERFWVKVQFEYKRKAGEEDRKKEGDVGLPDIDEKESNYKFQAWGAKKSVVSQEDTRDLKKARKEGRLTEAMLDRRSKLKSDRFC